MLRCRRDRITTSLVPLLGLILTVLVFPLKPAGAFQASDAASIRKKADGLYREQSYALAADEYRRYLSTLPENGPDRSDALYQLATSLIRSHKWDEAIAATEALLSRPGLTPMLRAKALIAKGDLYSSLPDTGWQIGDRFVWGAENPVVPPDGPLPKRKSRRKENASASVSARQDALILLESPLISPPDRNGWELPLLQSLSGALTRKCALWGTDESNAALVPQTDWTIQTNATYSLSWPAPKQLFFVLKRWAVLAESSPDGETNAILARVNAVEILRTLGARRYPEILWGAQDDGSVSHRLYGFAGNLPYASEDTDSLLIATAHRYPHAKIAPDLLFHAANDLKMSPRAHDLYQEILTKYPAYASAHNVAAVIQNMDSRFLSISRSLHPSKDSPNTIDIFTKGMPFVNCTLYQLDPETVLSAPKYWKNAAASPIDVIANLGGWSAAEHVSHLVKRWKFSHPLDPQSPFDSGDTSISLPFPTRNGQTEEGLYLFVAESPDGEYRAAMAFPISSLFLVRRSLPGREMFFVADRVSGQPIPNANVWVKWTATKFTKSRDGKPIPHRVVWFFEQKTDADGLCELTPPKWKRGIGFLAFQAMAFTRDRQFTLLAEKSFEYADSSTDEEESRPVNHRFADMIYPPLSLLTDTVAVYCHTDRPMYRPGQTVHFRCVLSEPISATDYRPLVAKKVAVSVASEESDKPIYTGTLTTSRFGTANGDFLLPRGVPLGQYRIAITPTDAAIAKKFEQAGDNEVYGDFQVEEYRLPEFSVDVVPDVLEAAPGQNVGVNVHVSRYDRSPIPNAAVEVTVTRTDSSANGIVTRQKLMTGREGTVRVTFPANLVSDETPTRRPYVDGYHTTVRYEIEATATDSERRVEIGNATVPLNLHPYVITLKPVTNFTVTGEPARYQLVVRTGDDKPVSGLVGDITIYRLRYEHTTPPSLRFRVYPANTAQSEYYAARDAAVIQRTSVITDKDGKFAGRFPTQSAGRYKVRFAGTGADGAPITGETTVLVGGGVTGDPGDSIEFGANPVTNREGIQYENGVAVDLSRPLTEPVLIADRGSQDDDPNRIYQLSDPNAEYRDGDTARLLLIAPKPKSWFLITEDTGTGITQKQMIFLPGLSRLFTVPIHGHIHAPDFAVEAMEVRDGRIQFADCTLHVPPVWQLAQVTVQADKKEYRPGETATFHLKATDSDGKPLSADISLGAIDSAMFSGWVEMAPPLADFLYTARHRQIYVSAKGTTDPALPAYSRFFDDKAKSFLTRFDGDEQLLGYGAGMSGDAAINGVDGASPEFGTATVRHRFDETAVWFPSVITDPATGEATVTVTFPDSLTTWNVTARAVTESVKVGETDINVVTTKHLTVRLAAPRFLVEGDTATLTAVVRNDLTTAKTVRVRMESDGPITGAGAATFPVKILTIAPGSETSVDFAAAATKGGSANLRAYAETDEESDAMQVTLPVLPYGVQKFVTATGTLRTETDATVRLNLPKERKADGTALLVQIAPGPMGTILDALPYLTDYPYGCAEQTMNRFLPSVLVARTLADSGVSLETLNVRAKALRERSAEPAGFGQAVPSGLDTDPSGYTYPVGTPDVLRLQVPSLSEDLPHGERWKNPVFDAVTLQKMTEEGMARLMTMRRADGGFGWWPDSRVSDPDITAYIVRGLAEARAVGIPLPKTAGVDIDGLIRSADYYLAGRLARTDDISEKTAILFALACGHNPKDVNRYDADVQKAVTTVYEGRSSLSPYELSLLALTLHRSGDDEKARVICRNLHNFARIDTEAGTATMWRRNDNDEYAYENSGETNAWALRAFLAVDPKSDLVPLLAEGLVRSRHGGYWRSTKETAIVVSALCDYFRMTGDTTPNMTAQVALANGPRRDFRITPENALLFDNRFLIPGELLQNGDQTITITKQGTGRLDYSAALQYISRETKIAATGSNVRVARRYRRMTADKRDELWKEGDRLQSGDRILVELTIAARDDYRHVLLEDLKPAGCELTDQNSGFAWGEGLWATCEKRDTKTAFFLDELPRGTHTLRYELRAETPGIFHALPVNLYAMYAPEIRALSDSSLLDVRDADPPAP